MRRESSAEEFWHIAAAVENSQDFDPERVRVMIIFRH
jgi:hypothetical protein